MKRAAVTKENAKRILTDMHHEELFGGGLQATDYAKPIRGPKIGTTARKPSLEYYDRRVE